VTRTSWAATLENCDARQFCLSGKAITQTAEKVAAAFLTLGRIGESAALSQSQDLRSQARIAWLRRRRMIRGMRIVRPEVLWRRGVIRIRPLRSRVFPVEWLFRGRMPRAATRDSRQNTQ
jgi:hypothetical protein